MEEIKNTDIENIDNETPKTEEKQPEKKSKPKKEKKARKKGLILRSIVTVVICTLIMLAICSVIILFRLTATFNSTAEYADSIMNAALATYLDEKEEAELLAQYDIEKNAKIANIVANILDKTEISTNSITELSSKIENASLYCYMDDGTVIKDEDAGNQIGTVLFEDVKREKNISRSGRIYSIAKIEGGWLILSRKSAEDFGIELKLPLMEKDSESVQIVDKKTGVILHSSTKKAEGETIDSFYQDNEFVLSSYHVDEVKCTTGITTFLDENWYYFVKKEIDDDIDIYVHVPAEAMIEDSLGNILFQILLTLVVFIIVVYNALFMYRNIREGNADKSGRKIIGKLCINGKQVSHLIAFLAFSVSISVLLTLYIQLLQGYSNQNKRGDSVIKNVIAAINANEEVGGKVEEHYIDAYYCLGDIVAKTYELYPEKLQSKELADIAALCGINSITLYDRLGNSVAASSGYVGYTLSKEEDSLESVGWQILDSSIDKVYRVDENTKECFAASKCQGECGAICLSFNGAVLDEQKGFLNIEHSLKRCNFGSAYVIYADVTDIDNTLQILDPKGNKLDNDDSAIRLNENLLSGEFSGNTIISGTGYYVSEVLSGNQLFVRAVKETSILLEAISGIDIGIIGFVLLFIVLVLCTCLYIGLPSDKKAGSVLRRETLMDTIINKSFKRSIKAFLTVTGIVLIGLAILEIVVFKNSTMQYLIANEWDHKFNLFSITMIIVAIVAANIISIILQKIVILIGDNLGARASTIAHMMCSLIKFGAMAAVILFSCVQLGASLSYIMTGAGFAGIVIGYAGQGIINDLLSGLFIVFEGNIQVGDWIAVDGWSGQVQEIGVRTTKIAKGGDTRVLNNSILSNVIVWSQTMSGAICLVDIAYDEDVDEVIKLINDNVQLYRDEDKHITDGPVVHGVINLGDSGVTIRIGAGVDDELYVPAVERNILRITKKLFDENDISIPFPQVVLNQPRQPKKKR